MVDLDATCAALAHPVRREILERVRSGRQSLGALAVGLPMTRPAVSQHVRTLLQAGLLSVRREGRQQLYTLRADGLWALQDYLAQQWDDVLSAFADAADADAAPPKPPSPRRPRSRR